MRTPCGGTTTEALRKPKPGSSGPLCRRRRTPRSSRFQRLNRLSSPCLLDHLPSEVPVCFQRIFQVRLGGTLNRVACMPTLGALSKGRHFLSKTCCHMLKELAFTMFGDFMRAQHDDLYQDITLKFRYGLLHVSPFSLIPWPETVWNSPKTLQGIAF